jgi:molybdopterin synthase catalytic subunit
VNVEEMNMQKRDDESVTEFTIRRIRAEILEECAKMVDDFHWTIPFYKDENINNVTDDVACMVQEQISAAIRAMAHPIG